MWPVRERVCWAGHPDPCGISWGAHDWPTSSSIADHWFSSSCDILLGMRTKNWVYSWDGGTSPLVWGPKAESVPRVVGYPRYRHPPKWREYASFIHPDSCRWALGSSPISLPVWTLLCMSLVDMPSFLSWYTVRRGIVGSEVMQMITFIRLHQGDYSKLHALQSVY